MWQVFTNPPWEGGQLVHLLKILPVNRFCKFSSAAREDKTASPKITFLTQNDFPRIPENDPNITTFCLLSKVSFNFCHLFLKFSDFCKKSTTFFKNPPERSFLTFVFSLVYTQYCFNRNDQLYTKVLKAMWVDSVSSVYKWKYQCFLWITKSLQVLI